MDVIIKSKDRSYTARVINIKENILKAKVLIKKGVLYQSNVNNFYTIRESPCLCVIKGVEKKIKLMSYNSINDYVKYQCIDITIAV